MTTSRSEPPMLKCGHVANAVRTASNGVNHDPVPCCAICDCIDLEPRAINLEGRKARCQCGREKDSSFSLAFFEFRGEGSNRALTMCSNCPFSEVAHDDSITKNYVHGKPKRVCDDFKPRGAYEYDSYYCGCRGWD